MPILNDGLTSADFKAGPGRFTWQMRPGDLTGFQGIPRVVVLPGGFKIYKFTGDGAKEGQWGVTPWWSSVAPWKEDDEGASGRYQQAVLNGIDMSSMVRYMSAVVVGWNSLEKYVEVEIHPDWQVHCFWGKFAPMKLIGQKEDIDKSAEYGKTSSPGFSEAVLPDDIGVLEAWQLYIPGLKDIHLAGGSQRTQIDGHDMVALGRHFGLKIAPDPRRAATKMPSAAAFLATTQVSPQAIRSPILVEMDGCLRQFETLCPTLTPNVHSPDQMQLLKDFSDKGSRYLVESTDPVGVKNQVDAYVRVALDWRRN